MLRGSLGGDAALESSKEELEEKREPKRLALSAGETAIVPSERKRGESQIYRSCWRYFWLRTRKSC